jgi:hypothetical protein
MIDRKERIAAATSALKTQEAKDVFIKLAEQFSDYSVFHDKDFSEAELYNGQTTIVVHGGRP